MELFALQLQGYAAVDRKPFLNCQITEESLYSRALYITRNLLSIIGVRYLMYSLFSEKGYGFKRFIVHI